MSSTFSLTFHVAWRWVDADDALGIAEESALNERGGDNWCGLTVHLLIVWPPADICMYLWSLKWCGLAPLCFFLGQVRAARTCMQHGCSKCLYRCYGGHVTSFRSQLLKSILSMAICRSSLMLRWRHMNISAKQAVILSLRAQAAALHVWAVYTWSYGHMMMSHGLVEWLRQQAVPLMFYVTMVQTTSYIMYVHTCSWGLQVPWNICLILPLRFSNGNMSEPIEVRDAWHS